MNIPHTYGYLVRARRDSWAGPSATPFKIRAKTSVFVDFIGVLTGPREANRDKVLRYRRRENGPFCASCIGAVERTRTSTAFRPMAPKAIASASSATTAFRRVYTSRWTGREFGPRQPL